MGTVGALDPRILAQALNAVQGAVDVINGTSPNAAPSMDNGPAISPNADISPPDQTANVNPAEAATTLLNAGSSMLALASVAFPALAPAAAAMQTLSKTCDTAVNALDQEPNPAISKADVATTCLDIGGNILDAAIKTAPPALQAALEPVANAFKAAGQAIGGKDLTPDLQVNPPAALASPDEAVGKAQASQNSVAEKFAQGLADVAAILSGIEMEDVKGVGGRPGSGFTPSPTALAAGKPAKTGPEI